MQHVSVNNWPEAARFNTKNHAWTPFRAFPRLFRNVPQISAFVPGISAFVLGAIVYVQFTHRHGCKAMPEVAQGL